jgi:RNA polymerase sigma factor (sigma-70 family)
MIAQVEAPKRREASQATQEHKEADAKLYRFIPDHVDYIQNPEYLCSDTQKKLFGPDAPRILVPQWRPSPEFNDGEDEVEVPKARPNLSRQDEALLFRRYNCARYHLASLMEKQMRRFVGSRVPEILAWYRLVLENRAALAQANMALVVAMVKRVKTESVDFGELVSEGNIALLHAVDKFDFSRGFKFSTYACSAIMRAFSKLGAKAGTYRQRFATRYEPEMERSDELERRHADQRETALEDLHRVLFLNRADLTDVEQTVLGARFALPGHDHVHTLHEVSELVLLSKERVRQVQNVAMAKVRRAMEATFSHVATSPRQIGGGFEDLATTIPGRLGLEVLAAAECGI